LWRPGHLMQHSITLLLGQIALIQPGGVLGHCPVEKQMIVPLSANQTGWRIAAECCGSHAGYKWFERWDSNRKVAGSNPRADKVKTCHSAPEQDS
jgi:hypothetical protein